MQIGDSIKFVPFAARYSKGDLGIECTAVPGRVVWIHPEGRFAVVERATRYYNTGSASQ